MNQRILHLAASHFPRDGEGNISATPEMIMEFAKVIVRECIELIEDSDWAYDVPDDDYDPNAVAMLAAKGVKEHFGVE